MDITVRVSIDVLNQNVQELESFGEELEEGHFPSEKTDITGKRSVFYSEQERYSMVSQLGAGGAGTVSLALDCDIGRRVAFKKYSKDGEAGKDLCKKELHILGMLDHGGIPTIYDFGTNALEQYFCTMQYVKGETLRSVIEKLKKGDLETHRRFQFQDRADIIIQLLRIVSSAHAKSVVHRDIKPENIMIGPGGEVTLIDWGIAKVMDPKEEE